MSFVFFLGLPSIEKTRLITVDCTRFLAVSVFVGPAPGGGSARRNDRRFSDPLFENLFSKDPLEFLSVYLLRSLFPGQRYSL